MIIFTALISMAGLLRWIVIKISFQFTPDTLTIIKHGFYRTTEYKFALSRTTLHYFRTHYSQNQVRCLG
jgi:hypothetical protein